MRGLLVCGLMLVLGVSISAVAAESTIVRGPVSATVRVTPDRVRIGDPIELELEVVAEPSIELLMPLFGESLERFRILEFVPHESIDERGGTQAIQRYRLQVLVSGKHLIPALLVEFIDHRPNARAAPQGEDAYELLTEPIEFEVQSVVPGTSAGSLRPALGSIAISVSEHKNDSVLWWYCLIGLLLAVFGGCWWVAWRRRTGRRSAYEIAASRLATLRARSRPDAAAMDSFFVELSDIVRHYLEDRFALHAPELTTEEFLGAAAVAQLDDERLGFLDGFLRAADRVKFARHIPAPEQVDSLVAAVADFLERTREHVDQGDVSTRKYSVA